MSQGKDSPILSHRAPRAVIFDAVGTLIYPEPSVAAAYAAAARRYGIDLPEPVVRQRFQAAFVRQERLDRERYAGRTNQQREIDRWRSIVDEVFGAPGEADAIFAALWDHFADPGQWRLFADTAPAWEALAARGIVIGIASNFDDRLTTICQSLSPLDGCQHLFVSSQMGWRKPHPHLFAAIADQLALAPHEILLVGDDVENDYRAAQTAGWGALLLDRASAGQQTLSVPHAQAKDTIRSLHEIAGRWGVAGNGA